MTALAHAPIEKGAPPPRGPSPNPSRYGLSGPAGVDEVGHSMGARPILELIQHGAVVALGPV
jgi:hypothetical protein